MAWLFICATFVISVIAGFVNFSQGSLFNRPSGKILQGILSIGCFGFVGWAFWEYGWKIGILELVVVFVGANVGLSILNKLRSQI